MIQSLGDILSRATALCEGRTEWVLSEASYWANLAAQEVFNQVWHQPYESLAYSSTTSGENRISLPSDFDTPISLSNLSSTANWTGGWGADGAQMQIVEGSWIDSRWSTTSGAPDSYALFSTWMELWPSPDSSYSLLLRYRAKQPTMIQSSDTPNFDERWHTGWLYKTAELLSASRGNPESEALNRNRYIGYMSSIPDDRARRQQAKGMSMSLPFRR